MEHLQKRCADYLAACTARSKLFTANLCRIVALEDVTPCADTYGAVHCAWSNIKNLQYSELAHQCFVNDKDCIGFRIRFIYVEHVQRYLTVEEMPFADTFTLDVCTNSKVRVALGRAVSRYFVDYCAQDMPLCYNAPGGGSSCAAQQLAFLVTRQPSMLLCVIDRKSVV